ncbi:MAG: patatin-like phospholipase family protein [Deltaproteobacteria bacterium]|nr:patatin-like phospholipase family protein [Deltaproteobacteria bacterium]
MHSPTGKFREDLSDRRGWHPRIYSAHVLERIQQTLNVVYSRDFDMVAGTSTGAILAAALAFGVPLGRVKQLYRERGSSIFARRRWSVGGLARPKYSSEPLRKELAAVFKQAYLRDAKVPLMIPATDIGTGDVHIFKSGYDADFVRDRNVRLVDAIVASCSAPSFFAPAKVGNYFLCDGGIWANNPSLLALTEAVRRLQVPLDQVRILSIGTGVSLKYYSLSQVKWGFARGWGISKFIDMLLNLQSLTANNVTRLLLPDGNYLRINFSSDNLHLDDTRLVDDLLSRADHDFSHEHKEIVGWMSRSRA